MIFLPTKSPNPGSKQLTTGKKHQSQRDQLRRMLINKMQDKFAMQHNDIII